MAMTQANHYTHTRNGILPHTEARQYDVAAFRDVNYSAYRAELRELRLQLLMMQEWAVQSGKRVAVVLEGRDAAGKGSTASGITHYLNPRSANVIPQGVPTSEADAELAWDLLQADAGTGEYHDFRPLVVLAGNRTAGAWILLDAAVQLLHDACERLGAALGGRGWCRC